MDIPLGSVEDKVKDKNGGESVAKEYTQWSVLKDLTNAVLYYYSYDDMNLKSIDLKKIASDRMMKVKLITMSGGFSSANMTEEMKDLK